MGISVPGDDSPPGLYIKVLLLEGDFCPFFFFFFFVRTQITFWRSTLATSLDLIMFKAPYCKHYPAGDQVFNIQVLEGKHQ